jgi:hypothetical protein
MGESFELAQALEARAELWRSRLDEATAERVASDETEAQELFAGLGVVRSRYSYRPSPG